MNSFTRKIAKKIHLERDWLIPRYRKNKQAIYTEVDKPLVLISQVQRSGGTLLNQLFDGHPELFSHPHEINWGRPKKWDWPEVGGWKGSTRALFRRLDENWMDKMLNRGYYGKGEKNKDQLPFVFDRTLQYNIFKDCVKKDSSKSQRHILNSYLTSFFNAWLDYQEMYTQQKKYVIGFIPQVITREKNVRQFFEDYPDGYIITIVRDPASWYASALRHPYFLRYENTEDILKKWHVSVKESMRVKDVHSNRVAVLLFEDLVAHTEDVMRGLSEKLNITFHLLLLTPSFNGIPISSDSSFVSRSGVDRSAAERYKETLTNEERKYIEAEALSLYKEVKKKVRESSSYLL